MWGQRWIAVALNALPEILVAVNVCNDNRLKLHSWNSESFSLMQHVYVYGQYYVWYMVAENQAIKSLDKRRIK